MKKAASLKDSAHVLYSDRRITVTTADIRTPTTYYPVNDTIGRRRRDILYAALGYSALVSAALLIYFDLWFAHERFAMIGSILFALIVGTQTSILQLDARGFPARLYFARTKTVKQVFDAISLARAKTAQAGSGYEPDEFATE